MRKKISGFAMTLAFVGLMPAAHAWELSPSQIEARSAQMDQKLSQVSPRNLTAEKLRIAQKSAPPAWTQQSYFMLQEGSKTYLVGVGTASRMSETQRVATAEARAKTALARAKRRFEQEQGLSTSKTAVIDGRRLRAQALDFYRDGDTVYALMLLETK